VSAEHVADIITVTDLAKRRGRSPRSIRRWLLMLEAKHGGIVLRTGTGRNARMYTTPGALARVAPHLVEPQGDLREIVTVMQKDVDTLVDRTTNLLARVRELSGRVAALERPHPSREVGRSRT
jgi:hypothetical protein